MKEEVSGLKDLLLAGERFEKEKINHY